MFVMVLRTRLPAQTMRITNLLCCIILTTLINRTLFFELLFGINSIVIWFFTQFSHLKCSHFGICSINSEAITRTSFLGSDDYDFFQLQYRLELGQTTSFFLPPVHCMSISKQTIYDSNISLNR